MKTLLDEPLAPYTSLNVGGTAERLVIVDNYAELLEALESCTSRPTILGYGCNVLIDDDGLTGTTIINRSHDISVTKDAITADSGALWDNVVQSAIHNGLWGLEMTSEIPSSVGGAIFGNIAAYGQQVSDTLDWIEVYDFRLRQKRQIATSEIEFSYRQSSLQSDPNRFILRAHFQLSRSPLHDLRYDSALNIARELSLTPDTLQNRRIIIVETRQRAGSIYHRGDGTHTAGSFFKNPLVSEEKARELASFDESGKTLERIEMQNKIHGGSSHRASAAHVLLAAGFQRGQSWGKVRLHPDHVLKLETLGGATASDVMDVVSEITTTVRESLDIELIPEVRFLGF